MSDPVLVCQQVTKSYHDGAHDVAVLKGIDVQLAAGSRTAIIGPSGCGKSTLLHLLGGVDTPSSGQVMMHGVDWQSLSEPQRCRLRNQQVGFVYQFHHLLPEFSALENVAMPLLIAGRSVAYAQAEARRVLTAVGLAARLAHKPHQLSGGEKQRVAIARGLVHQPSCVLADEPTGNLDQATAAQVFDLLLTINQQFNTALVIVTHDMALAKRLDQQWRLTDGLLVKA